jgi:hypothetical protein
MIEDKKLEKTQTPKSVEKNTETPVTVKVPKLKFPDAIPLVD